MDEHMKRYKDAIFEAKRFIERAEAAIVEIETSNLYTSKANASAKRSSMDLTNALVLIRK